MNMVDDDGTGLFVTISGNEPQFGRLRDFIRNGTGNPWFFVEDATGLLSFVPKGQAVRRWAHFLGELEVRETSA
jgi:hypothetical protein